MAVMGTIRLRDHGTDPASPPAPALTLALAPAPGRAAALGPGRAGCPCGRQMCRPEAPRAAPVGRRRSTRRIGRNWPPVARVGGQGGQRSAGLGPGGTPREALPDGDHRSTIADGTEPTAGDDRSSRSRPVLTPRHGNAPRRVPNVAFVVLGKRYGPNPWSLLTVPAIRGFHAFGSRPHRPYGPLSAPVEPTAETRITPRFPANPRA